MCVIQLYDVGTKMTDTQTQIIIVVGILTEIIFMVIMVFNCSNINLIFSQQKQRKGLLSAFYILATITTAALITSTTFYLIEDFLYKKSKSDQHQGAFINDLPDQTTQLAYFTILMIGAVQYLSICELTVHVGNLNCLK